jgi:DNA-binding IclR family transcriptional regulator
MHGLNEFRDMLGGLETIVGPDIIRSNGLAIILCLLAVANAGENINLATLAQKTEIQPTSLDRYIAVLKDAGVIELHHEPEAEWGTAEISLTQRARSQFAEMLSAK